MVWLSNGNEIRKNSQIIKNKSAQHHGLTYTSEICILYE